MQYVLCTSVENSPQTNPIIGRIECKAGHGAGRPTQKMVFDHHLICTTFYILNYSDLIIVMYLLIEDLPKTLELQIDETADRYSFMAKMLGASWIE